MMAYILIRLMMASLNKTDDGIYLNKTDDDIYLNTVFFISITFISISSLIFGEKLSIMPA